MSQLVISDITIPAHIDAFPIKATLFAPQTTQPSTSLPPAVLINSATGVPRGFYGNFAKYLASAHSCPVLIYDYRGHGDSIPKEGGLAALKDTHIHIHWATYDQPAATAHLHTLYPDRGIVIIGHSVGAHIAPLNPLKHLVTRYIFASSNNAFWGYHSRPFVTFAFPWMVEVLGAVAGYFPAKKIKLCDNIPLGVGRDWARWTRCPEYCTTEPEVKDAYDAFKPESAIGIAATDDHLCADRRAFDEWFALMPNAKVRFYYVEPKELGAEVVGHMGLFKKACKDGAWDAVARYIIEGVEPRFKTAESKAKL
ncbi:hypothetical protein SpCBS45565_g01022 [Spizellomyces sp. 'palustris']|nr:hypothetical protein SpCBS45565_g01022 [Spizellomyces sp. 'palustris']